MSDVTQVHLTVANSGLNGVKDFPVGTTLNDALTGLKLGDPANQQVKVNRRSVPLDTVLQPGDRVSVAPRNMKAA